MRKDDPRRVPGNATFNDWYITNDVNDEAWGLLQCTFTQACCWAVNHLNMSWEWHVNDPKENN
jgi:hypothetical protein